jgi:hypothetical protein
MTILTFSPSKSKQSLVMKESAEVKELKNKLRQSLVNKAK